MKFFVVFMALIGLILAACAAPAPAPAPSPTPAPTPAPTAAPLKPVELKAWSAWTPAKDPGFPAFNKFVEKMNEKGKSA
jgi:ABC-type glycerol-3-phosphate transport system substrate-binding protein